MGFTKQPCCSNNFITLSGLHITPLFFLLPPFLYIGGIGFCMNVNELVMKLIFIGLRREKWRKIRKLSVSSLFRSDLFVIYHAGMNYSTNPSVNLARVLYFGIFIKKYTSYIYRNGRSII
jgi:hypothetical protein